MTFLQNKQKTCSQKKTSLCRNENAATQLQKGKGRSYQWNFKTRIYNRINYPDQRKGRNFWQRAGFRLRFSPLGQKRAGEGHGACTGTSVVFPGNGPGKKLYRGTPGRRFEPKNAGTGGPFKPRLFILPFPQT